jgi:hypothetical protein
VVRLGAILAFTVPLAAQAAPSAVKTISVPCPDGSAIVQLRSGPLPRGVYIVVRAANGKIIGTVAPFGVHNGSAGTYEFPLPAGLARDGKVTLTLTRTAYGVADRAPTQQEVEALNVVCR